MRSISVYRVVGSEPLYEEPLYEGPLGSESAIREWWSEPATALGLPLLAAIYEQGFYSGNRWAGPELQQVLDELVRLEQYWSSARLPSDVLADLHERAGYLRSAVAIAKGCGGVVDVG